MVEKSEGLRKGGVGEWAERGDERGERFFGFILHSH